MTTDLSMNWLTFLSPNQQHHSSHGNNVMTKSSLWTYPPFTNHRTPDRELLPLYHLSNIITSNSVKSKQIKYFQSTVIPESGSERPSNECTKSGEKDGSRHAAHVPAANRHHRRLHRKRARQKRGRRSEHSSSKNQRGKRQTTGVYSKLTTYCPEIPHKSMYAYKHTHTHTHYRITLVQLQSI